MDTSMDLKTVHVRTEHEGMSFLTISLSNFRSHFELSLDRGSWQPGLTAFGNQSGLPKFLRGFLLLVFNTDGTLLDEPNVFAIRDVRQLTGLANKVELPTTEARNLRAVQGFIKCENDLTDWEDSVLPSMDLSLFDRTVTALFGELFSRVDHLVYHRELLPKHGPGATADRLKANQKWMQKVWPARLQEYFPYEEMLFPNHGWYQSYQDIQIVEPGAELPVKVTLVPKTLKTPRIIAIEPTAMQYAQQALLHAFDSEIEGNPYLRNFLSSRSQVPNQRFARQGSLYSDLATLDLSEASDRVSNALVLRMLKNHPHLRGAVQACRTTTAELPIVGGVMPLRKFASMGSALCFPFESMLFTVLIHLGVMSAQGSTNPRSAITTLRGRARTFGDDIICPVEYAQSVTDTLEAYALKVNHSKSFWTGKFRESCGKDYYSGFDVSYVKLRAMFPRNRSDVDGLVSTVSFRNQLHAAGFDKSVEFLDRLIKGLIPFPDGPVDSQGLVAHTHGVVTPHGFDVNLHIPVIRAMVVKDQIPVSRLGEHGALMKHFLKRGVSPNPSRDHLERAGRSVAKRIRPRWISAL